MTTFSWLIIGGLFLGAFVILKAWANALVNAAEISKDVKAARQEIEGLNDVIRQDAIVNSNTNIDGMSKSLDTALLNKRDS